MVSLNWQEDTSAKKPSSASPAGKDPRLSTAIVFAAIVISGSLLFLGLQFKGNGSVSAEGNKAFQAQVDQAIGNYIKKQQQAAQSAQAPQAPAGKVEPVSAKLDHIRGDLGRATVAVIEYSDMECPFCKRVHSTYQQIMQTYGDKVVWVYRDFPLGFHQNAHKEAEASQCAAELGGNDSYWKFIDYVFEKTTSNGTGFPLDQLPVAAKEAGVNSAKFQNCLASGKYIKFVDDEESNGQAAGVQGTPGNFVVNLKTQKSQLLSGAQPFESFKSAIDAALNE